MALFNNVDLPTERATNLRTAPHILPAHRARSPQYTPWARAASFKASQKHRASLSPTSEEQACA
eukprot:scaffold18957_cov60-Phaeocystis_antarctica.AAC.2